MGGEGQEVHIDQACACVDLKLVFVLGYERKLAEQSSFIFKTQHGVYAVNCVRR